MVYSHQLCVAKKLKNCMEVHFFFLVSCLMFYLESFFMENKGTNVNNTVIVQIFLDLTVNTGGSDERSCDAQSSCGKQVNTDNNADIKSVTNPKQIGF